jgi:hypothetical protein
MYYRLGTSDKKQTYVLGNDLDFSGSLSFVPHNRDSGKTSGKHNETPLLKKVAKLIAQYGNLPICSRIRIFKIQF